MRYSVVLPILAVGFVAVLPTVLAAQTSRAARDAFADRTPVTLVAADGNADAKIKIIRRVKPTAGDFIVVPAERHEPEELSEAIWLLQAHRAAKGLKSTTDVVLAVVRVEPGHVKKYAGEAETWLRLLSRVSPAPVRGFGEVRSLVLHLDNKEAAKTK